jgi:D-3-phosphoglycerate dehydrogenase / 2-oxoglutarate reductase
MTREPRVVWLTGRDSERRDILEALERAGCEVRLGRRFDDPWHYSEQQLMENSRDVDAIMLSTGDGQVTRRVMEAAPRLMVISKRAIGVGDIDVDAATNLGILVTNAPHDFHYLGVAEFTVAMILALANNVKLADHNARQGKWRSVRNTLLCGKTVGVVGLGRIGSAVVALMRPFGVRFLAFDPHVSAEGAQAAGVELVDLERLLAESDFVTLHAVETAETANMINEERLGLMKPTACLVNTARGSLVDEEAVARALREGRLREAALDVFRGEIPKPSNPLLDEGIFYQTLFAPHAAALNAEAVWAVPLVQLENCLAALRGEVPPNLVNAEALPSWRARHLL